MGSADYYADGQWNFYCHLCGAKQKSSTAMKTWDGFYVCKHHKAKRNPQDKLRGVREIQGLPWSTSNPYYTGAPVTPCSASPGHSGWPGLAVPGCALPSAPVPPPSPTPGVCTLAGASSVPAYAVPGCLIPGNLRYQ